MSSETEAGTPQVFIGHTPGSVYSVVGEDFLANVFDIDGEQFLDGGADAHSLAFLKKFKNSNGLFISAPTATNLTSAAELDNVPAIANIKGGSTAQLKKLATGNCRDLRSAPLFNAKYEPYVIYKSLIKGELSMYVLAGDEKDAEKLGRASGTAEEMSKVMRNQFFALFFPGTCSFERIQKSLDRASKFLPFLNGPLVKTGDKPLAAPTAAAPSRPASKPISRPTTSRPAVSSAASSTTSRAAASTRPASAKPATRPVQPARVPATTARAPVAPQRTAVAPRPARPAVSKVEPKTRPAPSRPAAKVTAKPLNNAAIKKPAASSKPAAAPLKAVAPVKSDAPTVVAPPVIAPPVVITASADDSVIIIDEVQNGCDIVVIPPTPEPTAIAHEEEHVEQQQHVQEQSQIQEQPQEPQVEEEVQEEQVPHFEEEPIQEQKEQEVIQGIDNVSTPETEFATSETKNQSLIEFGEAEGATNLETAQVQAGFVAFDNDSTFTLSESSNAQDTTNNSAALIDFAELSAPAVAPSQEDSVFSKPGDITDLANKLGGIALDSPLPFVHAMSGIIASELNFVPPQSNGTQSVVENPVVENGNRETSKHELMQERSTILSNGNKGEPEYEKADPLIDGILDACANESEQVDEQQQQQTPQPISLVESEPLGMVKEEAVVYKGPKVARPYYFDFVNIPRNEQLETTLGKLEMREFVHKIRSRHYILASKNAEEDVLDSIHYGFKLWENSNLKCSIHPTHHNSAIGQFKATHNDESANFEVCLPISNSILRDGTGEEYKVARIALRDEFD
ncbi:unnamed protein product [Caenorhabditis angaria]|uniref:Uncharacterized protein n=1 Tax=Caenorhabditis angaria TaxID=860376 RepID=A0A9P1N2T7_9PELO|nr:unnamed protein product [Caenorhabditis angaria]